VRAVCDSCELPQPSDWEPGNLCVHCGLVARREKRCHWCVAWTPDGKFCRSCGSQTVADEHYGAARMLKNAGVDQFTIPQRIEAMEADQLEHFTRMYQRQATVVTRHVDDAAFVESFLTQTGWSAAIEDDLVPKLPLPDDELNALKIPPSKAADPSARLEEIFASTPFPIIRALSSLARLKQMPATLEPEFIDTAMELLKYGEGPAKEEAALIFGHWRMVYSPIALMYRSATVNALYECSRQPDAAIALRLLDEDAEVHDAEVASADPDRAFQAALALVAVEPLINALRDDDRRFAAASRLAYHNPVVELGPVLAKFTDDQQEHLFNKLLSGKAPVDHLHDALMERAEHGPKEVRSTAITLLYRMGRIEDAERLVRLSDGSDRTYTIQAYLQNPAISAGDTEQFLRFLVTERFFNGNQYGMDKVTESDRVSARFVPGVWGLAVDDEMREQLLRFAEEQLGAHSDESLHEFVLRQIFAPNSIKIRETACWVLHRWYGRSSYNNKGPLQLEERVLTKFFGSVDEFLRQATAFLADQEVVRTITCEEFMAERLHYCDNVPLPDIVKHKDTFGRFWTQLGVTVRDDSVRQNLRAAIIRFMEHISTIPEWRDRALAEVSNLADQDGGVSFEATHTRDRILENRYVNR
jgi:RNA polymerase subunit RPABC4/transcription elongation factor Spt4